jgi:2-iminobutanoate/2-iminopropanoate deaminase
MNKITRYPSALPAPFSKAVRAGGFLFLSGVLAMDTQANIIDGDIGAQTRAVLASIKLTLEELGSSMADVVRATVWLADLNDFAAFNEEYKKHFLTGLPARATVQAALYKGAKVEIEVQAWVGS